MKLLLKILPPFWAIIYMTMGMGLHFIWLWRGGERFPMPWVAAGSMALGFTSMVWAWKIFHRKKTAVHPFEESTCFVTEGPYRFTRNPMYLGMTLILFGIAFMAGTVPALLIPFLFFLTVDSAYVPFEEKKMGARFGEAYLHYRKRVRRWF